MFLLFVFVPLPPLAIQLAACSRSQLAAPTPTAVPLPVHRVPVPHNAHKTQFKGGREKKMTKATYICRSAKKKVVTYFILFLFLFFIDFF
jgi:hypothetical protein